MGKRDVMPHSVFVNEAADLLGVSRRTIYYRIHEGRLRTVRSGNSQRVLVDSIYALMREEPEERSVAGVRPSTIETSKVCGVRGTSYPPGTNYPYSRRQFGARPDRSVRFEGA